MKKLYCVLPDDITFSLCGKSYINGFIRAGYFTEKEIITRLNKDRIIKFSPDYILFFDFEEQNKKLIKSVYEKNKNTVFIFYLTSYADSEKSKFIKSLSKAKFRYLILSADKDNLKLSDKIIYLPLGISAKKYKTEISGYKNVISIFSNPENPKFADLFKKINPYFKNINFYCDEIEYINSLESQWYCNLDEETQNMYKDIYKGSVLTEKEKAKIFSESYINVILTDKIRNGVDFTILEAMASTGIVFCEPLSEINRLFDVGHEIETFENFDELIQKAEFYIKYPFVGQSLGLNARSAVINNHSVYDKVKQIMKIIDKNFNGEETKND